MRGMCPVRTLESSVFHKLYKEQPPPQFAHELLGAVHRLVMTYCKEHRIPEQAGKFFFGKVQVRQAGPRAVPTAIVRAQAQAMQHADDLLNELQGAAQRLWTSPLLIGAAHTHTLATACLPSHIPTYPNTVRAYMLHTFVHTCMHIR